MGIFCFNGFNLILLFFVFCIYLFRCYIYQKDKKTNRYLKDEPVLLSYCCITAKFGETESSLLRYFEV